MQSYFVVVTFPGGHTRYYRFDTFAKALAWQLAMRGCGNRAEIP